jgi:ribosome biogenesis GTPase / thiamine phosphate phosphatase
LSVIINFMNKTKISLEDLGYNEFFESERKRLKLTEYPVARVVAEYKEIYRVRGEDGEYLAKITGKQMFTATKREDYPAVGDWVVIEKLPEEKAIIRGILPRKTILKKKYSDKQENQIIATNIDTAFIAESMDRDYSLNRFERYLVLTAEASILPAIILNKTDLISSEELKFKIDEIKNRFNNIVIIPTSTVTEQGLNDLRNNIVKGRTYCFLGSSGVGKSSLINELLREDEIKTKEISESSGKGKHTTTAREMYFLGNGGIVIDNPGTREVGIAGSDMGIKNVFDEISLLSKECRFSDCTHLHEPDCAILKAVEEEKLDKNRYTNYVKLKKESEFYKMTDLEKREKDRSFGRFIKKYQKNSC